MLALEHHGNLLRFLWDPEALSVEESSQTGKAMIACFRPGNREVRDQYEVDPTAALGAKQKIAEL